MSARAHIAAMILLAAGCGGSAARPLPARAPRTAAATADRDGDGASDAEDACPDQPEDCDGYQDEDGCPDPDNDHDGIPDICDVCPDQPETMNGYQDEDGCPDKPIDSIVEGPIRISPTVLFPYGSAKPVREAQAVVDEIVAALHDHPEIQRVGVVGHAAPGEPHPLQLAARRAKAVAKALEAAGIAASRLETHSLGARHPIADPRGSQAARNRRVGFKLVKRSGVEVMRWTNDGYELVETAPPAPPAPGHDTPPCRPPKQLPAALHKRCAGSAWRAPR